MHDSLTLAMPTDVIEGLRCSFPCHAACAVHTSGVYLSCSHTCTLTLLISACCHCFVDLAVFFVLGLL